MSVNVTFTFIEAGLQIFSLLVGQSDPWSKKWLVIFWNDGPKHIKLTTVNFGLYTLPTHRHRHLFAYMHIDCWLYSKTCLKWPLKKEDQLSLYAGQKYCRMPQGEHSAILSTFIKLLIYQKLWSWLYLQYRYVVLEKKVSGIYFHLL